MNKAELVETIANKTGYAKSLVNEVLSEIIETIAKTVHKEPVQLVGLGTFKPVRRKARMGVNPITGKKINAYLVYGDQRWSLEMASGMERFISGLAIRVALINICNLPRPNFLVIDEGFGSLDPEVMQSMFQLFSYLKTQFDFVMIISHIDSLRDVVDNLIEIKKVDGFSHIKY